MKIELAATFYFSGNKASSQPAATQQPLVTKTGIRPAATQQPMVIKSGIGPAATQQPLFKNWKIEPAATFYFTDIKPAAIQQPLVTKTGIGPAATQQPLHSGIWLVIASGMTIFFFLKTGLNLKETLAKNILAYVSVDFSIK